MSVSNFEPINIIMMLHSYMLFQQILALYIFISYKFSEEPEEGIDERCYRANGFFNHEDENECNKWVKIILLDFNAIRIMIMM